MNEDPRCSMASSTSGGGVCISQGPSKQQIVPRRGIDQRTSFQRAEGGKRRDRGGEAPRDLEPGAGTTLRGGAPEEEP